MPPLVHSNGQEKTFVTYDDPQYSSINSINKIMRTNAFLAFCITTSVNNVYQGSS